MTTGDSPAIALTLENRVLERSVRVRPGRHELPDVWRKGALVIDADDVVIDFQGAVLTPGGDVRGRLDELEGYGILVKNRRNVTIRNAVVRGYRFNICVLGGENIRIENCDVSFSRAQRIWERGAPRDEWVVLREINDWRTYGAGVWLERVRGGLVHQCRACSAQNGIVLVDAHHCRVTENDCSFNSGWGIALWQSCDSEITWNRADFCNRPWAGGLGGDSSCVTVAGSCHRNFFVGNSMTHGGDGFFLTGTSDAYRDARMKGRLMEGSCDDNIVAHNDGSWCPANAFEGTFAYRNVYYQNRANHCGYGFWLGFSCDSRVLDNDVRHNRYEGVAIEHGAGTRVEGNRLAGNGRCGVHLYTRPSDEEGLDRYPSRDLEIRDNRIQDSPAAVDLTGSTDYYVGENTLENAPLPAGLTSEKEPAAVRDLERFRASPEYRHVQALRAARPPAYRMYAEEGWPCGWEWTQFDAFAPHDFRDDLAAVRRIDAGALELFVFQPGETQLAVPKWAAVQRDAADPRRVRVDVAAAHADVGEVRVCEIALRQATRGQVIRRTLANVEWRQRYYAAAPDGRPPAFDDVAGWQRVFDGPPVAEAVSRELGPGWIEDLPAGVPRRHFALQATMRVRLPGGAQRLCATFDDGLRLFVDGQRVYENWRRNRPQFMDVTLDLAAGAHELTVQYCYEDRHAVLKWHWPEPE